MKKSIHSGVRRFVFAICATSTAGLAGPAHAQDVRIVATIPTYAAIAREITGDLADVQSIARGDQDSHFVNARPSFAALIQRRCTF